MRNNRYRLAAALLVAGLTTGGTAFGQSVTTIGGSVYGGGNIASVGGSTTVNLTGGVVGSEAKRGHVFGGGYGQTTTVGADVTVNIGTKTVTGTGDDQKAQYAGTASVYGDVYGGSALGSVNTSTSNNTQVNLYGGTIHGDAYGGGLGQIGREAAEGVAAVDDVKAQVNGNVTVILDGARFETATGTDDEGQTVQTKGRIFGCNNLNGTPLGSVLVHVFRTVPLSGTAHKQGEYEVAAVYGGGNLADYDPANATSADEATKTSAYAYVIIDGCDATSIYQVYGGGNAASTPATKVDVNGSFEIDEVFGGGNGLDRVQKNGAWGANPGANVGYYAYGESLSKTERNADPYVYGSGRAETNINGGTIHSVFGGSNTKGNIREVAVAMLEESGEAACSFVVDEAYGGGKAAPMDGEAQLIMKCIPGLGAVYGGSENADVNNNVSITITNGTYNRVFGGNNLGGTISGTITVNIEETGCHPVIIDQVYGGGNQAAYTAPEGEHGPTVNVKSCTRIGEVFGGGFGETAVVTGDTYVNINQAYGKKNASDGTFTAEATELGTIGTVYGGGNEARVDGNTNVNIGTETEVGFESLPLVESQKQKKTVVGANITGNVYGGGNAADVTGQTHVTIGREPSE